VRSPSWSCYAGLGSFGLATCRWVGGRRHLSRVEWSAARFMGAGVEWLQFGCVVGAVWRSARVWGVVCGCGRMVLY
jgi:hypothetical protein